MPRTVLERYGGFPFLSKVVMSFYERVLDSDVLGPYFEDVDMRRLIDHQTKFVAFLMGGPASYTNDHLAHIHARLGVTRPDFDVMIETMQSTLEDFDLDSGDISDVIHELRSRAPWIVSAAESEARRGAT